MKRKMYTEVMYDYSTKDEAYKHKQEMKDKGWLVKDEYEQKYQTGFNWTVEYYK